TFLFNAFGSHRTPLQREARRTTGQGAALSADADGAEAENNVAAGNFAAETGHRVETREEQHLIQFVLHFGRIGTGKDLVANHFAVCAYGNIEHEAVRKCELGIVIFRSPISGRVGKSEQLGRLHDVERDIVGNGLNGDARRHQLKNEDENQHGGNETASGGQCDGTKNIVEENFHAIAETLPAAG